jgi:hypothetical protein
MESGGQMPLEGIVQDSNVKAVLGPQIGTQGSARTAFERVGFSGGVIKQSRHPLHTSNRNEWLMWCQMKGTPDRDLLGTCYALSGSGEYLIMEDLRDLNAQEKQAPAKRPQWVSDVKAGNFGVSSGGQVKLRDYGQLRLGSNI